MSADPFATRDCQLPGCPRAAEGGGVYCREHADSLPDTEADRLQGMWANRTPCKRDGCENPRTSATHGPYAGLCAAHTLQAREQRSREAKIRATGGTPRPRPAAPVVRPVSSPTPSQQLVELAQEITDAANAYLEAQARLREAEKSMRWFLDALREAAA